MRKILLFAVFGLLCGGLSAQVVEQLNELEYNARQYYSTKKFQPVRTHRYLIDKAVTVVSTDTLRLPFVDDFSTNELRSYKWVQNNITDTFYNVFGTCLGNEGIKTIDTVMLTSTAWEYFEVDTINHIYDSVAVAPDTFTFFGILPSGCFVQTPQTFYYWPPYTRYWYNADSARVESELITTPSDTISYAPVVYFAKGEAGTLWFDNYAYVNNTYPVNPPTIGVATLDGLNEFGLPYNNTIINSYGYADVLTSLPIDIDTMEEGDSIYLSFFYEPQGLGDYPDKLDSLLVDFKDNSGTWRTVWSDTGYSSVSSVPQQFKQVLIAVPSLPVPLTYFHNTFQFRFRNKASLYGNNDHWHIDYVKMDKQRFAADTNIQDIAFVYPIQTILRNFTLMPADQFSNPADLRDSIVLTVRNLDRDANNNPPATNFTRGASEIYPTQSIVAADALQTFNAADYNYIEINPGADYAIPQAVVDSLVISSVVFINPNDTRKQNDTLTHIQHFNSVMAYDDGSAEKSYGITGLGLKKFAYEFNLNQPDTLAAFQVHFAQVDVKVNDLIFNFYAWDSLQLNNLSFDDAATTIFSLENKKPFYIDSVNGFATYKLDTPVIVSGKLYFGWAQTDDRRLQVGYDLNSTLGRAHMFIFRNNVWQASTISPEGSPMIRLIFDRNFWGGTSSVLDLTKTENAISVFPNPTSGVVYLRSENRNSLFEVSVFNMFGQVVKQERRVEDRLDISELMNGIYLFSVRDIQSGKVYHKKIIKTSF